MRIDRIRNMVKRWVHVRSECENDDDSQDRCVRVRELVIETMRPVRE